MALVTLGLGDIKLLYTAVLPARRVQGFEDRMQRYEYRVIPAPRRGEKGRGLKTAEEKFAFALTTLMNKMGAEGWQYQRADALPCDERVGLTGSKTSFQNVLVFRRAAAEVASEYLATTPDQRRMIGAEPENAPMTSLPMTAEQLSASLLPKPMLGGAKQPSGAAPALGPANPDVAAQ